MPTITIEATLVRCMDDVIAEAGQYLCIVNGVCIGVHDGAAPAAAPMLPAPTTSKATASRAKYYKPSDVDIIKTCAEGPFTVYRVNTILGLHNGSANQSMRDYVGRQMRHLVSIGQLRQVTDSPFSEKFPGFVK